MSVLFELYEFIRSIAAVQIFLTVYAKQPWLAGNYSDRVRWAQQDVTEIW